MIGRLYRRVKAAYYRHCISSYETAIDRLENRLYPELWSFWHGGPLNGRPRQSVEEHLFELQRRKHVREKWLARYQATKQGICAALGLDLCETHGIRVTVEQIENNSQIQEGGND